MKLNSRSVTQLGLLLVFLLTIAVGLLGNRQVVVSLERQYTARSLDYSRELADAATELMAEALDGARDGAEVARRFRELTAGYDALGGTSIYLFAVADDALAPEPGRRAPPAVRQLATEVADGGEAWAPRGRAEPRFRYAIGHPPGPVGGAWVLAIETDMGQVYAAMQDLHYRISALLVLAVTLIAGFSFLGLRRLGWRYERQLQTALAARTAELEAAYAEILHKARLATLGQTASMLTHELRNPLASIKFGLSGLLERAGLAERDQRRLQIILREVDRLNEMLSDTLGYVRPIKLSERPLPLQPLIEEVAQLLEPLQAGKQIKLRLQLAADCPPLRVDPEQLRLALVNLVKNALEASPVGEAVTLRLYRQPGEVCFEAHNGGPPVPATLREHLFEPFRSGKSGGTGLGLTLIKRVVEEHGGSLHWESSAATGNRFGFHLPQRG